MGKRKRSKLPWSFVAAGAVFAGAVLWQVLPKNGFEGETPAQLENRLSREREERERELRMQLEEWRTENDTLRREIERLGEKRGE